MNGRQIKTGDLVRDTITGFQGIVVCRAEWLNGCVRATVQPKSLHEGKPVETSSFDVEQLEIVQAESPRAVAATGGDRPTPTRAADPRR